ncbi:MAG: hypothetical protein LAP61_22710 [Acidobacteriia bacterium]|nr:hypothetical protein [Terriglobia bacterium]
MTTKPSLCSTADSLIPSSREYQQGDTDSVSSIFVTRYVDLLRRTRLRLRREDPKHLHEAAAVLNEAYTRMRKRQLRQAWRNPEHILQATSIETDRLLVEDGRARRTLKRGGRTIRVPFDAAVERPTIGHSTPEQTIALREVLKQLAETDHRIHQVIYMRFFDELSRDEIARRLGLSIPTVRTKLRLGLTWLRGHLEATPKNLVSKPYGPTG